MQWMGVKVKKREVKVGLEKKKECIKLQQGKGYIKGGGEVYMEFKIIERGEGGDEEADDGGRRRTGDKRNQVKEEKVI